MGASALISALNAIPWDGDEDGDGDGDGEDSSDSSDDSADRPRQKSYGKSARPKSQCHRISTSLQMV